MRTSSFGRILSFDHEGLSIEYLEFERSGRFHHHATAESFTVLEGEGFLWVDHKKTKIQSGKTYFVPPKALHKMAPSEKQVLKVVVSYKEV